jgi:hypothetical protein
LVAGAARVARIEVELTVGRVLAARNQEAPPALNTDARRFLIRAPYLHSADAQGGRPQQPGARLPLVQRLRKLLERFPAR